MGKEMQNESRMRGRHHGGRLLAAFLAVCMLLTVFPVGAFPAAAAETTGSQPIEENGTVVYQIRSFNDLRGAADYSCGDNWEQVQVYRLMNDISITEKEMSQLMDSHLTFGTDKRPFCAEFDGGSFTISGLTYKEDVLKLATRTGLFAYTGREADNGVTEKSAYIHDLTIDGANVYADFDAGILIGDAYNTTVENVTVKNSTVHVFPADNVLTLVADGGVFGGGMAGYSKDSIFYNCEVRNVSVLNNKTGGVQALGGKGLYLGGLVGVCDNTTLEYCRADGGRVSNYYDVAVGALGGNTLYVGGLVGKMRQASKALDCFATNTLYYYCANYVSVGSGTAGHAGGIAGGVVSEKDGISCSIKRCHFAGEITSEQINSILVLPVIIQYNVNRSGLVNSVENGVDVSNSYFNKTTTTAQRSGKSYPADTLTNDKTGQSYGPKEDDVYMDRSFWAREGYDFGGLVNRKAESAYQEDHYNKWVMRYVTDEETGKVTGMPVHGKSVAGAFDFPGAGSVTVSPLAEEHLSGNVARTEDAATFAVLPFYPGEGKVGEDDESADGKVKIEFTPASAGYRLEKWYMRPETTVTGVGGDISVYANIYGEPQNEVSAVNPLDPRLVKDNELYLARVQANVVFYDVTGNTKVKTEKEWYHYNDKLPEVTPQNAPSGQVKLVGWTTEKPYKSITSTQLEKLKQNGNFYMAGDPVQKTLKLYPVYANLLANTKVQIEGHDATDPATRTGVGSVTVESEGGRNILRFTPEGGALPDGYRFLGWYEQNADGKWYRVGTTDTYSLENVDMTVEHRYEARFEYRVDYYAVTGRKPDADNTEPYPWNKPYAQLWQQYNSTFDSTVAMPADYHGTLDGWYEGIPTGVTDENCSAVAAADGKKITAPYIVHNHRKGTDGTYKVFVTTDFPGSATVNQEGKGSLANNFAVSVTPNAHYNFLFWASDEKETSSSTSWKVGGILSPSKDYGFEAHMTADAVFYRKDNTVLSTVQRRYGEKLFLTAAQNHTYTYPLTGDAIDTAGSSLNNPVSGTSPTRNDMVTAGYYFVGWVDKDALTAEESAYLYDVAGDDNVCSSVEKALPYVLKDDAEVTKAMPHLYPIYAKYDIETGTNVVSHDTINSPADPTYAPEKPTGESAEIALTAFNNVLVVNGGEEKFALSKLTVQVDGGEEVELTKPADTTGDWHVNYTVKPGHKYFFKAWYQPYTLVFHVNATTAEAFVCNADTKIGSKKGAPPASTAHVGVADLNETLFVGWTTVKPAAGAYHKMDTIEAARLLPYYSNSTLQTAVVTRSCEFWPVYVKYSVKLGAGEGGTASVQRSDDATTLKVVASPEDNHTFIEWRDKDGKPVTKDTEFTVPDPFGGSTYTPVFETVYHVKYYKPDGTSLLYEDELGGLTDQDVVLVTARGEVLSAKPYALIANEMQNGQHFAQWVWKNGTTVKFFEAFCHDPIVKQLEDAGTTVMELYPVVWNMTLKTYDDEGTVGAAPKDTKITVGKSTGSSGQLSIRCDVPKGCTAHKIVVEARRKTWETGGDNTPIPDVPVILTSGTKRLTGMTDASGNAEFILNKKKATITVGGAAPGVDGTIQGKDETYDGQPKKGYDGEPAVDGYTGTFKEIYYEKTGTDEEGNPVWKEISSQPIRAGDYKVKIIIPASDPEFEGSAEVTFRIIPAPVTISGATAENSDYDGTEKTGYTGEPTVTAGGYTGTLAITYYKRGSDTALPGKPTDAGDYTVKIAVPVSERNYTGSTFLDFSIAKVAYTGRTQAYRFINSTKGSYVDVTLPILPAGAQYGDAADGSLGKIILGDVDAASRTIRVTNDSLTVNDAAPDKGAVQFTVPVTGATNYNDYVVTVTITPTAKTEAKITATHLDAEYDGDPKPGYVEDSVTINGVKSSNYVLLYRQGNDPVDPAHPETPPTEVGSYTVKISVPDNDANYFGSITLPFEITTKDLTGAITGVTGVNATYGSIPADYKGYTGEAKATGYDGGFKVTYFNERGKEITSVPINAGQYTAEFTPTDSAHYTGKLVVPFKIDKQTVTISATSVGEVEYDGARKLGYEVDSTGAYEGRLNTVYTDKSTGKVLTDQPIHVGDYSVTISIPDEVRNYKGSTKVDFKITAKKIKPEDITGVTKQDGEADGKPKPGYKGEPTIPGYKGDFETEYQDEDGTKLPDPPTDVGKYTVIIKPSDPDYEGEKELTFEITKKDVEVYATPQNSIYNGQPKPGYKDTPTATGYTGIFNFTYFDGTGKLLGSQQPSNVGSYKVKIAIPTDAPNQSGETLLSFEITPRPVKITGVEPKNSESDGKPKKGYEGTPTLYGPDDAPITGYTGGFKETYQDKDGNTLPSSPKEPGEYKVVLTPNDPNYAGEKIIGFTITAPDTDPDDPNKPDDPNNPGGGGGNTTYPVNIPEVDGAKVDSDHETAQPGEKVTITVTPDEGKKVDKVTVTDDTGKEIPVTDNGDGTWSFDMPASGVTVEVELVCPKDKTCPISKYNDSSPTAWYHDGVHYCLEEGLMVGYNATKFGPNDKVTRSQLVQILYSEAGRPAVTTPSRFKDVKQGAWYEKAIIWGDDNKVVYGYSDTKFGPNDPITREQLATILYRHAGSPETTGSLDKFTDGKKTSAWATAALQWAVENKIIYGRSGNTLAPGGTASRAEAASMIQRYLVNYVGKKSETEENQKK